MKLRSNKIIASRQLPSKNNNSDEVNNNLDAVAVETVAESEPICLQVNEDPIMYMFPRSFGYQIAMTLTGYDPAGAAIEISVPPILVDDVIARLKRCNFPCSLKMENYKIIYESELDEPDKIRFAVSVNSEYDFQAVKGAQRRLGKLKYVKSGWV